MQVETDDFIYSLTAGDVDGNEQTEIVTADHSDIPADLVHTDVSDLENNASLWLDGFEGALESNEAVSNISHHVTSIVEEHAQMSESMAHMVEVEGQNEPDSLGVEELQSHSQIENITMEPMEVDVQTTEVSSNKELVEMSLENFMEQTDIEINPDSSSTTTTKEEIPLIPVTLSLPSVEPRTVLPSAQQRKTTISIPSSSQVTKVVLSPAGQNQSGQPLLFTVPSSATGLTSLLTPTANLRFVNAVGSGGGTKVTSVGSSLASGVTSHPMRLMSPTKTITLQQAQQLGLISPKKGQSLVINKVTMASGGTSTASSTLLTGKPGAKFAGGNVTLVRSAPTKTPTKIAPAPPQSIVTTVASSSSTQPTSLLIKNAAGQVTMATLVQARPSTAGIANLGTMGSQKFVLRPATPGSIASAQVRQGSGAPAQYIRLTTAQALAAGILPAVGAHSDGSHQQLQLAGNKIQLVRVVTPSQIAANNSSGNMVAVSNSSKMVIGSSSSTVKITSHSLAQSQANKSYITSSVSKPQVKISTSSSQTGVPPGVQRILLPAGSMSSISNNIVMLPAHYSSQNSSGSNASVAISLANNANTVVSDATSLPVMSSTSARSSLSTKNYVSPPSPESSQPSTPGSKAQGVLESNGLKPRKPCNCTKSQCLKLYCDCFANGEFCHGCNCVCCANNLEHEELRLRAIRSCLDRNPHAFKPKIGVGWGPEPRRHNKGCHCKRSGCLKNYCECYEAKIACSAICKCIGCKNCVDPIGSPPGPGEKRNSKIAALVSHPNSTPEARTASNTTPQNSKVEERTSDPPKGSATTTSTSSSRPPFSFITQEVVEATCQCLLAQAEEAERQCKSSVETEGLVLEEFGRCLLQIIEYASKAKVTASP